MIASALHRSLPYPPLLCRSYPNSKKDNQGRLCKHAWRFSIQSTMDIVHDIEYEKQCKLMKCIFNEKRCSDVFSILQPYLSRQEHLVVPEKSYLRLICKMIRDEEVKNIQLALNVAKQCDLLNLKSINDARLWYISHIMHMVNDNQEIYIKETYWL